MYVEKCVMYVEKCVMYVEKCVTYIEKCVTYIEKCAAYVHCINKLEVSVKWTELSISPSKTNTVRPHLSTHIHSG
jgi:hypothetical protein